MAVKVFRRREKKEGKIEDEVELKEGGPGCTVQPPVVSLLSTPRVFKTSTAHAGSGLNPPPHTHTHSTPCFYLHVYVRP